MTGKKGRITDFFISYTNHDRAWAEWIAWQLEAAGYSIVLQAWNFRPGSDFVHKMQHAIAKSKRTIAILSPDYFASRFGEAEWRSVFASDPSGEEGLLVPVRIHDFEPPGLLGTRVYIDLVGRDAFDAKDALLQGVAERDMRPTREPHFPGYPNMISYSSAVDSQTIVFERTKFPGLEPSAKHRPIARSDTITVPSGHVLIMSQWSEDDPLWLPFHVAVAPNLYSSFADLLDELFINYLNSRVSPFSYGSEWILTINDSEILAPLEWVENPRKPIRQISPGWADTTSLSQLRVQDGMSLNIKHATDSAPYGVVSNDNALIKALLYPKAIALLGDLPQKRTLEEIDPDQYRFRLVLNDRLDRGFKGRILDFDNLTINNVPLEYRRMLRRIGVTSLTLR